jgi:hypothetical protein
LKIPPICFSATDAGFFFDLHSDKEKFSDDARSYPQSVQQPFLETPKFNMPFVIVGKGGCGCCG